MNRKEKLECILALLSLILSLICLIAKADGGILFLGGFGFYLE
ncbi:hypothetical protein EfmAA96_08000 [Enterococcus faecium]|nr:hypothetical protein EfmAA96_08000 [Enterococcus faecium]